MKTHLLEEDLLLVIHLLALGLVQLAAEGVEVKSQCADLQPQLFPGRGPVQAVINEWM